MNNVRTGILNKHEQKKKKVFNRFPSIHPAGTTALSEPWPPQLPASTALYPSPSLSNTVYYPNKKRTNEMTKERG